MPESKEYQAGEMLSDNISIVSESTMALYGKQSDFYAALVRAGSINLPNDTNGRGYQFEVIDPIKQIAERNPAYSFFEL